jgi:galactitol-specific phosphotransferase system IIB component
VETPAVETPAEEIKLHPAYDKLLAEIPEAWHSKVTPFLQEQDRNFQQQLEKYTPFKDYVDQADLVSSGLNLAKAIESDPVEVFNSLKEYLVENGMLEKDAEKQAAEIVSEQAEEQDEELPPALKKKLDELESFKTEQEQRAYQQELEKATEVAAQELDRDMATLKSQFSITEAHEMAIYNLMNAALGAGQELSVADAAKQLQQMVGNFTPVGGAAQQSAPVVVGSSGGAGVPAPDLSVPKDDKGKKEMLAQMFQQYNAAR